MRIPALLFAVLVLVPHSRPAAQAAPPPWRAVRDARAGVGDGPGALTAISYLSVGRDNNVYVSQPQDAVVRVYDARGRFLRKLGRRGEGPGEFQAPGILGWRGDTLWVADGRLARISLFGPGGAFVRSVTFTRVGPITDNRPNVAGSLFADGSVLGLWQAPLPVLSGPRAVSVPLVRFTAGGQPVNVVARVPRKNEFVELRSGTGISYAPQPFTDSPLWAPSPDGSGIVVVTRGVATAGRRATFAVRKFHFSGRQLFATAHAYTPRPLAAAAVNRVVEQHVEGLSNARWKTPPEGALRRMIRGALYRPRYVPPVTGLTVGRDGTVWLRREETGAAAVAWDVLDAAGRRVARVALPTGLEVLYADRTQVWGVERDELDVPTLVRFRVVHGG